MRTPSVLGTEPVTRFWDHPVFRKHQVNKRKSKPSDLLYLIQLGALGATSDTYSSFRYDRCNLRSPNFQLTLGATLDTYLSFLGMIAGIAQVSPHLGTASDTSSSFTQL